jgi:hypothetical protein
MEKDWLKEERRIEDGGKRNGQWNSPPSLVQFKNIFIKELK